MAALSSYPLLERIAARAIAAPRAPAIVDSVHNLSIDYATLAEDLLALAVQLSTALPTSLPADPPQLFPKAPAPTYPGLGEARIVLLLDKGYLFTLALLATWTAGGLAVPLLPSLPVPEHVYRLDNADCALIVCDAANRERADHLAAAKSDGVACTVLQIDLESVRATQSKASTPAAQVLATLTSIDGERRAMMLYTSGTTGRPKGAVTRHSALAAQVADVVEAWRWTEADNLLHVLPLNHLHGIAVALLPSLWAGASVEMWDKMDPAKVWHRWINTNKAVPITMFFGVPTVYTRLIQAHAALPPALQSAATAASATLRLQVSGSAPLPVSLKAAWESPNGVGGGQVLLERYGMTETGLIATTGWENDKRVKGYVGFAMPSVAIRLAAEDEIVTAAETQGGIQVSGPGITKEYWRLPEATAQEFTPDGWFKTGDVGVYAGAGEARGMLRILGRSSVDIIKSGGEKISAVEVERAILELEGVSDCAVVGVADDEWGQVVAACIVTSRAELTLKQLRDELRGELAAYMLPRKLKIFDAIPRNGMGKVQKKLIVENEFPTASQ